jgi:hypothetical protein
MAKKQLVYTLLGGPKDGEKVRTEPYALLWCELPSGNYAIYQRWDRNHYHYAMTVTKNEIANKKAIQKVLHLNPAEDDKKPKNGGQTGGEGKQL